MPVAAALLKLVLFALWARPTYKSTIEMLEMRERRLGLLPEDTLPAADKDAAKPTPETAGPAPKNRVHSTSKKHTRAP